MFVKVLQIAGAVVLVGAWAFAMYLRVTNTNFVDTMYGKKPIQKLFDEDER